MFTDVDLRVDVLYNSDEKTFKCDVYTSHFSCSDNLQSHIYILTLVRKLSNVTYICAHPLFKTTLHILCLWRHTRKNSIFKMPMNAQTHTVEKRFKCDNCGKRVLQSSDLTVYVCTHAGDKPFKCDTCGAHFSTNRT